MRARTAELSAGAAMELEIDIEEPWPDAPDWEALACRAVEALAEIAVELDNPRLITSILFTSDSEIHALNREWRQKDKPTNVLSFPMMEPGELSALASDGPPVLLGDIALAQETCAREAAEKGVSLADHAAHLLIHGMLHLAGHDHEISTEAADIMEKLEIKALAQLGIADPYGDHTQAQGDE
jgi:probable rRNA maturation factor